MRFTLLSALGAALLCLSATASPSRPPRVPKGFVTTKGSEFQLDGKPFYFVGANSYWLPLLTSDADVERTFDQMQKAGVKVLRTWGFNAINGTELPGALESGLTYYQVWNSSEWTLNAGPQGLQRLDKVIDAAGRHGIKVILAFTNNWVGYGGMELYINWIAGAGNSHDVFYTNPKIIASYQRYVRTIVNRYKNSPNVFAWELMNEARCSGDLPAGPGCVPGSGTLHTWYKQQSDFVRSLDPYHLITTGGEGHFYWKDDAVYGNDYNYDGQAGEDFDADMTLPNIDFGTYHIYPEYWYSTGNFPVPGETTETWGVSWITQHAQAAKKANKPVILEEFGLSQLANKTTTYPAWVNAAIKTDTAGIMPWQFGALGLKESGGNRVIKYADALIDGASPNDGFALYSNQTTVYSIFTNAARIQAAKSH